MVEISCAQQTFQSESIWNHGWKSVDENDLKETIQAICCPNCCVNFVIANIDFVKNAVIQNAYRADNSYWKFEQNVYLN